MGRGDAGCRAGRGGDPGGTRLTAARCGGRAGGAAGKDARGGPAAARQRARAEIVLRHEGTAHRTVGVSRARPDPLRQLPPHPGRGAAPGRLRLLPAARPGQGRPQAGSMMPSCTFFPAFSFFRCFLRKPPQNVVAFPPPRLPDLRFGAAYPFLLSPKRLPASLNSFGVLNSRLADVPKKIPRISSNLRPVRTYYCCGSGNVGAVACRWRIMCLTETVTRWSLRDRFQ